MASAILTDGEVLRLARDTFQDAPEPWRRPEIIVRAAADFGGDDALYITAVYPDGVDHLSGSRRVDLQIALGDRLRSHDDHRLIYLSALTRSDVSELRALEAEIPSDAS